MGCETQSDLLVSHQDIIIADGYPTTSNEQTAKYVAKNQYTIFASDQFQFYSNVITQDTFDSLRHYFVHFNQDTIDYEFVVQYQQTSNDSNCLKLAQKVEYSQFSFSEFMRWQIAQIFARKSKQICGNETYGLIYIYSNETFAKTININSLAQQISQLWGYLPESILAVMEKHSLNKTLTFEQTIQYLLSFENDN